MGQPHGVSRVVTLIILFAEITLAANRNRPPDNLDCDWWLGYLAIVAQIEELRSKSDESPDTLSKLDGLIAERARLLQEAQDERPRPDLDPVGPEAKNRLAKFFERMNEKADDRARSKVLEIVNSPEPKGVSGPDRLELALVRGLKRRFGFSEDTARRVALLYRSGHYHLLSNRLKYPGEEPHLFQLQPADQEAFAAWFFARISLFFFGRPSASDLLGEKELRREIVKLERRLRTGFSIPTMEARALLQTYDRVDLTSAPAFWAHVHQPLNSKQVVTLSAILLHYWIKLFDGEGDTELKGRILQLQNENPEDCWGQTLLRYLKTFHRGGIVEDEISLTRLF